MKKAAIDIGSNSIRMLIGEVKENNVVALEQHLRTTRLGKTEKGGCLNKDAVTRTILALGEFKEILKNHNLADKPIVAATSAVREAADKEDFRQLIKKDLDWDLQILSGEEEAERSYLGASSIVKEKAAVIDVGGGSTELIFADCGQVYGQSVPVGAVRLHSGEVKNADLGQVLEPLKALYKKSAEPLVLVGVGGTITSLAAMKNNLKTYTREAVNGTIITRADLENFYAEITSMNGAEILQKYPLLKNREDIIGDGISIYLELFKLIDCDKITVSDAGILDGLLIK